MSTSVSNTDYDDGSIDRADAFHSGDNELTNLSTAATDVTAGVASEEVMSSPLLRAVLLTLYTVIFVLGVSGNSLVVHVVWRNKSLQTITNIFIANLAASDVMMCLLAVPFTPISGLLSDWIFGKALCHLVPMTMAVSIYVSTLTSTAIAIDRYFAIVHPFRARMTIGCCLMVIAGVWAASVTVSLPLAIHQNLTETSANSSNNDSAEVNTVRMCLEDWPQPSVRRLFTVGSLVLQYLVPCAVIIICYWRVSVALKRRAKTKKGMTKASTINSSATVALTTAVDGEGSSPQPGPDRSARTGANCAPAASMNAASRREQLEIRRNRRTNRMLIASVAIFVCCWLPLNVMFLLVEYREETIEWKYYLLVFFVTHVVAMSSTIYNPFLYAWMNDAFRTEFVRALPRCLVAGSTCCRRRRQNAVNGETGACSAGRSIIALKLRNDDGNGRQNGSSTANRTKTTAEVSDNRTCAIGEGLPIGTGNAATLLVVDELKVHGDAKFEHTGVIDPPDYVDYVAGLSCGPTADLALELTEAEWLMSGKNDENASHTVESN